MVIELDTHNPIVSVIIPHCNGEAILRDCLSSLYQSSKIDIEVILVDNGSRDGSIEFIEENFPATRLIRLRKNTGFSVANDIGKAQTKSEYIATLNNDTQVKADWLEKLVSVAETQRVDMVASKMIYMREAKRVIDSVGIQPNKNGLGYNVGNGSTIFSSIYFYKFSKIFICTDI